MKTIKNKRTIEYSLIVIIIFVVLAARLFYLQIIAGDDYRNIASDQAERYISQIPPRGEILDVNGKKLATNVPSYSVTYSIHGKTDNEQTNKSLSEAVKIIYKNGEQDKINDKSLPIKYDSASNTFGYYFNIDDEKIVKDRIKSFIESNKLTENADAKTAFYELAKKDKLTDENNLPKYGLSTEMLHKVLALRLAINENTFRQYMDITVANNVSKQTFYDMKFRNNDMPDINCDVTPLRYYPNGEVGSSFLGYLKKISDDDKEKYSNLGYDVNRELIGATGLEKSLENNADLNIKLHGEAGQKWFKVDNRGRIIDKTGWTDPIPGDTVQTTINLDVQKVAEQSFDEVMENIRKGTYGDKPLPNANRGAMVVMNVNTGEIIAFVSRPGFDPNVFAETGGLTTEQYNELFRPDKIYQEKLYNLPVNAASRKNGISAPEGGYGDIYDVLPKKTFNYASCGTAPPGSTFKPLTAIAALEEGKITPSTIIVDQGVYRGVPGIAPVCWIFHDRGVTHGPVNVSDAIKVSCNYFFYEVGNRLGYEKIGEWAYKFGLGRNPATLEAPSTGIEIEEQAGSVGSPKNYKINNIRSKVDEVMEELKKPAYNMDANLLVKDSLVYKEIKEMLMNGVYDEGKLEKAGVSSSKAKNYIKYKINQFNGEASNPGNPLSTAIGQGDTNLSPLQMAQYISTLVNGGTRYKAHLVKKVLNPDGSVKKEIQPQVLSKVELHKEYVDVVKEGMKKVTEEGGTASSVFSNYPIETGGKTGSAEFGDNSEYVGRSAYGWYVGFAPYDNPEIAVAAVVYDGGHGNYVARAVKDVYDEYFGFNKQDGTQNKNQ